MPLESATYINQLVVTNPAGTDLRNTADDHLRLIKTVLTSSFTNVNNEVSASAGEINYLRGVTSNLQTQLNNRLNLSATANNSVLWEGARKYVSTASASGAADDGSIWFRYIE